MLMPSIFGESLLDDFFNAPFTYEGTSTGGLMQTDVKDMDDHYEIIMNLPGIKKEEVQAELKDGYLTITASSNTNKDEKDSEGRYIRRERRSGSCSRSFYVGDQVTEDEIKAKFENGTLTMRKIVFLLTALCLSMSAWSQDGLVYWSQADGYKFDFDLDGTVDFSLPTQTTDKAISQVFVLNANGNGYVRPL